MMTETVNRKYELDWLRVFAILIVFLYHSTRFFDLTVWHVKALEVDVWAEMWTVFLNRWMMPLFFAISGGSLYFAIDKAGGWKKFYSDKFLRLMIPLLIASVTHSALQVYLERLNHGRFSGSFISFYPEYFRGIYLGIGISGTGNFAFHGMHLWYLLFLFLYSLLCYPLFRWLKTGGTGTLNNMMTIASLPGVPLIAFSLPLVILKAIIPAWFLDVGNGGWGFLYYLWFLIAGFLIVSREAFLETLRKQYGIYLFLGVSFSAGYLYFFFGVSETVFQGVKGNWALSLLSFFCALSWLFGLFGLAIKYFRTDHPHLKTLNEGVLPFFILHQTVLLVVGYQVIYLPVPNLIKWVLIAIVSFGLIIILYLYIIRKLDLLRFLFGLKTTRRSFNLYQKPIPLSLLLLAWIVLTLFASLNQQSITRQTWFSDPLTFDAERDIVLNADSIASASPIGVQRVDDPGAASGQAIEFSSGAQQSIQAQPKVYVEFSFEAPAGRYYLWIRGKSDIDSDLTDSLWVQVDHQIATRQGTRHLGNWNSFHPIGVYAWASDLYLPATILLRHSGTHRIRLQPRQTPFRIDQIWLSQRQHRIPDSVDSVPKPTE